MFSKLLPREGNFFELFDQHADRLVEGARAFLAMVQNYGDAARREQIHGLINGMDDILDLLQDTCEVMSLYDLRRVSADVMRLTEISVRCCERVANLVEGIVLEHS